MLSISSYGFPIASSRKHRVEHWELKASVSVLLIHDMQHYFVSPFAAPLQDLLIENIRKLRDWADLHEVRVVYTAQPGSMTREQRGLLQDFWGEGMARTIENVSIVDSLVPRPGDWQVDKWRYSALVGNDLLERLRSEGTEQVVIAGVYGSVGILATALDLFGHDFQPFMVSDAMGDFDVDSHARVLEYAADYCARVLTTEQIAG